MIDKDVCVWWLGRVADDAFLEEHVYSLFLANAVPQANPVLVMLGGGAGSGKTSARDVFLGNFTTPFQNYTYISPDLVMAQLPMYQATFQTSLCAACNASWPAQWVTLQLLYVRRRSKGEKGCVFVCVSVALP